MLYQQHFDTALRLHSTSKKIHRHKMTKRLLIIGTLGQGLDVETMADTSDIETMHVSGYPTWFKEYLPKDWEVRKLISSNLSFADLREQINWLNQADLARVYYTGHGFHTKQNGKVYRGYYLNPDTIFTADFFVDNFLNLLTAKEVQLITDMCYAGGTRKELKEINTLATFNPKNCAKVKDIELSSSTIFLKAKQEGKIKANKKIVFLGSSTRNNASFGAIRGGTDGSWCNINTGGNSWFTYNLITAYNLWAQISTGYPEHKQGLKFILQQTKRLDNMLTHCLPYPSNVKPQCPTGLNLKNATVI